MLKNTQKVHQMDNLQEQYNREVGQKTKLLTRQKHREKQNINKSNNLVIDLEKMKNYQRIARIKQQDKIVNTEIIKQKSANNLMAQIDMDDMFLDLESDRQLKEQTLYDYDVNQNESIIKENQIKSNIRIIINFIIIYFSYR